MNMSIKIECSLILLFRRGVRSDVESLENIGTKDHSHVCGKDNPETTVRRISKDVWQCVGGLETHFMTP